MRNCFSLDLTQTSQSDKGVDVGRLRIEDGKIYRLVKNATLAAVAAGDVLFHGTNDPTFKEAYQMNQSTMGTNLGFMAGVAVVAGAIGDYMWLQVWGYNSAINTMGHASSAVGVAMIGVNGQNYCTFSTASGTAPLYGRHIVALEAWTTVSAALKKGLIRCM